MRIFFFDLGVQFLVEQAGLDVVIVLVLFAGIFLDIADHLMVEHLANGNSRIDSHGLNGKQFQGPVSTKADVTKARRDMHEQSQASHGRTSFHHRYQVMGFGPLHGSREVKLVRAEDHSIGRNLDTPHPVHLSHVQHDFLVDQQFIMKCQVVAVRIQVFFLERIDKNRITKPTANLFT